MSYQGKLWLGGILALFLYLNIIYFQSDLDQIHTRIFVQGERPLIFPRASVVRALSLGHRNLLADYYWLKEIQYLGKCIEQKIKPFQLFKYAQFITEIDPYFFEVYYYTSAVMIAERIMPEEIVKLLERGKKYLPDKKQIPFHLGFTYYYFLKEYDKAAENLDLAAKLSGYLPYAILAARIRAEKGNIDLSMAILQELVKETGKTRWSRSAIKFLKGLEQKKYLEMLNEKVREYFEQFGFWPKNLEELVKAGLIKEIPQDPVGGRFYLDPNTHQVKSTKEYYVGVYKKPEWMEQ